MGIEIRTGKLAGDSVALAQDSEFRLYAGERIGDAADAHSRRHQVKIGREGGPKDGPKE